MKDITPKGWVNRFELEFVGPGMKDMDDWSYKVVDGNGEEIQAGKVLDLRPVGTTVMFNDDLDSDKCDECGERVAGYRPTCTGCGKTWKCW